MVSEKQWSNKPIDIAIAIVAIAMAIYHMVSTRVIFVDSIQHQNIHLGFGLTLVFLFTTKGAKKRWQQILWLLLLGLSLITVLYVQIFYDDLTLRNGFPTNTDAIISVMLIFLLLVSTAKAYGPVFSIICLLLLFYALFGHLVPDPWRTYDFVPARLLFALTLSFQEGAYGTFLGISANYLFLFLLFGALMQISGTTRFFEEVGKIIAKRVSGGAALSSVVTSAMVGTVTGSVGANIVTTGSFTIPFMKRAGYKPHQAGAIEATASTGGMIMPPVMGAAAFIMAAWTGIPYIKIAAMAAIPAILYFVNAGIYAQLQALRMNIKPTHEAVNVREMLINAPSFFVPLIIIIVLLMFNYSLAFVVSWAIIAVVVLSLIRKKTRPSLRQWVESIVGGADMGAQVAVSIATIGIAAATMMQTGLVLRLPAAFEMWSGGNLALALILCAVIAIILGMGLPTTAVYVMMALTIAPILIRMGVTVPQAHLFVFYYGMVGFLTPPVAVGAVIAAKLAGASYFKTAIEATKAGLGGFLVPFFMILTPAIMFLQQPPIWALIGMISSVLILLCFQIGICGHYLTSVNLPFRWFFLAVGAILLLSLAVENYFLSASGLVIFIVLTIWQWMKRKKGIIKGGLEKENVVRVG